MQMTIEDSCIVVLYEFWALSLDTLTCEDGFWMSLGAGSLC